MSIDFFAIAILKTGFYVILGAGFFNPFFLEKPEIMAENYIDIFDSTSAPEIELVELTLRRHGIKYRVQSKTVIESTNMLVTGGIGARLQVEAASYERALQVLEAAGLNVGAVPVEPYPWIEKFAGMTNGFPILKLNCSRILQASALLWAVIVPRQLPLGKGAGFRYPAFRHCP